MAFELPKSAYLEKIDQQYTLLRPQDSQDASVQILQAAYDAVRIELVTLLDEQSTYDVEAICKALDKTIRQLFAKKTLLEPLKDLDQNQRQLIRRTINEARLFVRGQLYREYNVETKLDAPKSSAHEKVNVLRKFLELEPIEEPKTIEDELAQIPESVRNAYLYMVEELGMDPALLTHLLCVTHTDHFNFNDATHDSIANFLGKCQRRQEPAIPNIPPAILISPQLSWFRVIFFRSLVKKYFLLFDTPAGVQNVADEVSNEIAAINAKETERLQECNTRETRDAVQHEYALKRRFLHSVNQFFIELDIQPHPTRLKTTLGGDEAFPNNHQKAAIFLSQLMGKFFNATEMGGGKTGYGIGFFESMREKRDENNQPLAKKALIICPSGIVKVWRTRLTTNKEGYFITEPKVAIINSTARMRAEDWQIAQDAEYIVLGMEMSRSSTDGVSHEELVNQLKIDTVIIDEQHNAKNTNGKESSDTERIYRMVCQNPTIKHRVLLSGTPIPNHPKDLAAAIRLLHAQSDEYEMPWYQPIDLFESFINQAPISTADAEIIAKKKAQEKKVTHSFGSINFHDIGQIVRMIETCEEPITQHFLLPYLYRIDAADSLPIRAKMMPIIEDEYELSPIERMYYERIVYAGTWEEIADIVPRKENNKKNAEDALTIFDKSHLLRRICLHSHALPGIAQTGLSKKNRLYYWLDKSFAEDSHDGKIAIASPLYKRGITKGEHALINDLRARYETEGVAVFILDGDESGNEDLKEMDEDGTPMTRTKKVIAKVRDYPGKAILLTQMGVVKEGVDLSFIARAITLAPDWNIPNEDQFWRRFYRRGQLHDVQCVKLMARNTIESGMNVLAHQKLELGERMLNSRELTQAEKELLTTGTGGKKANTNLWWILLPPKEQLSWLWGQFINKGAEHIRKSLKRWGPTLARLYNKDWETSYNGNVARVVGAIVDQLLTEPYCNPTKKEYTDIADVAAGAFAIERTLIGRDQVRVWSSDINPAMISDEMGQNVLGSAHQKKQTDVAAMDALPYKAGSKNIAVLSLGLHYGMHGQESKFAGMERIRTVLELSRIVTMNGYVIITFPPSIFRGRQQEKHRELSQAFRYFGFEVVPEFSDKVSAKISDEEKKFETFVFTLKKVKQPVVTMSDNWEDLPEVVVKGLDLSRVKKSGNGTRKNTKRKKVIEKAAKGTYFDEFVIGSGSKKTDISFKGSSRQLTLKSRVAAKDFAITASPPIVQIILGQFQTLEDVPPDTWLEVPLDALAESPRAIQDAYAQALLTRETRLLTKEFLATLNQGQAQVSLAIRTYNTKPHLVFSRSSGSTGKLKHTKYPIKDEKS